MNSKRTKMEDTLLSSSVSVAHYYKLEKNKDREKIANFILGRFSERYITPLRCKPSIKHGFSTMAISCLMIEVLESFYQGWGNTKNKSSKAFSSFFNRCLRRESELGIFDKYADEFYKSVRCGILHQAETTNGWRIHRKGVLFEPDTKTVNATRFHNELENYLHSYCEELKRLEWNDKVWQNLRNKMQFVIKNCTPTL